MEDCIITEHEDGGISYNRYFHNFQLEACAKLKSRYSLTNLDFFPNVSLFPSGMNAIDTAFHVLMMQNKWREVNIIYGSELYCDTPRTIKYIGENYVQTNLVRINVIESDIEIINEINKKIQKDKLSILFVEACSNPNGNIFNLGLLKTLKKQLPQLKVIVDNTWLTSAVFNPFIFKEVDIVVNSLTKYYGGDRSGIMGTVICRDLDLGKSVDNYGKVKGLHVCPRYCEELCKNIDKMDERIKKTSEITLKVAEYLDSKSIKVSYPKLKSHPSYNRAIEYYGHTSSGPSVLTFTLTFDIRNGALKWMRSSKKFKCLTSFGASDSRFDQWPQAKKKRGRYDTTCRFSIGYDDKYTDIIEELDNMLEIHQQSM